MFKSMPKQLKRAVCLWMAILFFSLSYASPAIAHEFLSFQPSSPQVSIAPLTYSTLAFLEWLFGRRQKEDDRPARTVSAGRRGPCSDVSRNFVGFVPPEDSPLRELGNGAPLSTDFTSSLGLTVEEFPKLWFHIPTLPNAVENLELMVQDENGLDLMDQPVTIPIASSPGVYAIDWKTSGVSLELDKAYHWYLSIVCNAERPSRNPSIDAWIQRVSLTPSIASSLAATPERDQIALYLEDGIWHDPLTRLAQLRCRFSEEQRLAEDWITLLESIGIMHDIAIAPIAQCPSAS